MIYEQALVELAYHASMNVWLMKSAAAAAAAAASRWVPGTASSPRMHHVRIAFLLIELLSLLHDQNKTNQRYAVCERSSS
jgi:hypothetical protein